MSVCLHMRVYIHVDMSIMYVDTDMSITVAELKKPLLIHTMEADYR